MPRPLDGAVGERMELDAYYADFQERYFRAREFWKLESGQVFAEPGKASWKAFARGDWPEALRLLEERREELTRLHQENAARGTVARRIRIVALPVTPYLQWELHSLKIRDESGGNIRILRDTEVADLEDRGPLPDIYTIDRDVMYQAVYDDRGVLEYALRFTDKELVSRCRDFIADLYERGEPIDEFFKREIACLPPPGQSEPALPVDYLERTGRPYPVGP